MLFNSRSIIHILYSGTFEKYNTALHGIIVIFFIFLLFIPLETIFGESYTTTELASMHWNKSSFRENEQAILQIQENDRNLNPLDYDIFSVKISSDSDPEGIYIPIIETSHNSGKFTGIVYFTNHLESRTVDQSTSILKARVNDTVTAKYVDQTVPLKDEFIYEFEVVATTNIHPTGIDYVEYCNRCPSNFKVVDAFGNTLSMIHVNQKVQLVADVPNGKDQNQEFTYIVQITNTNGIVLALEWISGTLSPGQSFSPAIAWTPIEAGTYNATAFVWNSIENPIPISYPMYKEVIVTNLK